MKKLAKMLALAGAMLLSFGCLGGCGEKDDGILDVVCTIFPQYDWTQTLAEGNGNINFTLLQSSGIDLHNYQPTAADKVKILKSDLLIYVGGESDKWVEDMLSDPAKNPALKVVKLLDFVDALDEEEVPGGEHDHEEEREEGEKDEHVWLSLKNAHKLVDAIGAALKEVDPASEALYERNRADYVAKLDALEREYAAAAEDPARKILLFGDRFPFRYLAEDYGLSYYAAFSGCSAETEASFEVIANLVKAVDDNQLPYILVLESSDQKIAEQIKKSTRTKDQTILVMNSIQSITQRQIEDGANYLSLMEENLKILKTALN